MRDAKFDGEAKGCTVNPGLYGYLTALSLVLALVLAACASVFVQRLRNRAPSPISEELGSTNAILDKVRKRQPLSREELGFARQIVADRSSPLAYCIPGALFMIGCFYVFGSLEQLHGAAPSERTFLGVFPMLASANLAVRLLGSARLKRRLPKLC